MAKPQCKCGHSALAHKVSFMNDYADCRECQCNTYEPKPKTRK
jgi:hypothetical protein